MQLIRNDQESKRNDPYSDSYNDSAPAKIGTEVFDCTLPSELEF